MDAMILQYSLLGLCLFILFWLGIGYFNYRKFRKNLLSFKDRYDYHMYMERNAGSVEIKVKHFNRREELVYRHPSLHAEMLDLKDNENYWKQLRKNYLLLGIVYNII